METLTSRHLYVFVSILCTFISTVSGLEMPEYHQEVLDALNSESYDNNILPPQPPNETLLKLFINLGLREIEDLNDSKMELKAQISLRQKWVDTRIKYSSQNEDGFVTLLADLKQTPWTPDVFFFNEKSSSTHSITRPNSFFRVYPNGTVLHSLRLSLVLSCPMDLRRFPFDRQQCEIKLTSYSYPRTTMELHWDPIESFEQIGSHHLTQFSLLGYKTGKCVTVTRAAGEFSTIYLRLKFKRIIGYYMIQLYTPVIMSVIITWVSFWMGPAVEARLSLTVTVLLTLSTQISGSNDAIAKVSYTTAFSTFTGVSSTFAALSIFQAALVFTMMRRNGSVQLFNGFRIGRKVLTEFQTKPLDNSDDSKDKPQNMETLRIDQICKIMFPASFFAFLIGYAIYYHDWSGVEFDGNDSADEVSPVCPRGPHE